MVKGRKHRRKTLRVGCNKTRLLVNKEISKEGRSYLMYEYLILQLPMYNNILSIDTSRL